MKIKLRARAFARLASALAASGIVMMASCRDATPPVEEDETAGSAVVGLQVRSELTLLSNGRPVIVRDTSRNATVPILYGFGSRRAVPNSRGRSAPGTVIRHFKQRSGITTSVGLYFDRDDAPPKYIYVFENGRIQSIVSPTYRRHGRGYVRTKAKMTVFSKDGVPIAQVNQSTDKSLAVAPETRRMRLVIAGAARDVAQVFLPTPLHAEENGACLSEWVSYTAKAVILAAATTALTAAAPSCIPVGVGCALAGAAFLAWVSAVDGWNAALDKLAACIEKNRQSNDGQVTSGGSGEGDGSSEPDDTSIYRTVEIFIRDAVASGNFWCSEDYNRCVYYAS